MSQAPNPRGLYCPACRGVRLTVVKTYRPSAGVLVRYRKCVECRTRLKTEERTVQTVPPK